MTKPGRPNSRSAILEAALSLLQEVGARHLTLDAVAQRAGISKGGLLYNFPSKTALLAALIEHHMARDTTIMKAMEDGNIEVTLKTLFDERLRWLCDAARDPTAHGMLAALAEEPALLEPVRQLYRVLWDKVKQGSSEPSRVWLTWLAIDGLLFGELFGTSPLSDEEGHEVVRQLQANLSQLH